MIKIIIQGASFQLTKIFIIYSKSIQKLVSTNIQTWSYYSNKKSVFLRLLYKDFLHVSYLYVPTIMQTLIKTTKIIKYKNRNIKYFQYIEMMCF